MGRPKNVQKEWTNKQAYDFLQSTGLQWDRKDKNHIVVWTLGYKTTDCHDVERELMKARMCCVGQDFDKICGKTYSIFKHQAK